jgi:DNA-binding MarR family transcriptional regulator
LDEMETRENHELADETIRSLSEQLGDPGLKSSTRVLILILLTMNRKMNSVELRALTGTGKGSLENHLEKLEVAGYVRMRNVKSFGGLRQTVEITEKGLQSCRTLLRRIQSLDL